MYSVLSAGHMLEALAVWLKKAPVGVNKLQHVAKQLRKTELQTNSGV